MALIPDLGSQLSIPGLEDFVNGVQRQAGGMFLLPTNPGLIGVTAFPFDELYRDADGMVMQYQTVDDTPDPTDYRLDGGDSAHKTGVLAFCGNLADQLLLPRFEDGAGLMVRHPTQQPWQNPHNCTRDQLINYMGALWRSGQTDIAKRLLQATEARQNTCQDYENDYPGTAKNPPIGDPIFPHQHMYLRVCAGQKDAHFDVIGQFFLQADIDAAAHRDDEITQLILMSIVCCRLDYLVKRIPNYQERLNAYWGGWRKQQQIATALGEVVKVELERYKGFMGFSFPPLPMATILAVAQVIEDAVKAIKEGKLPPILNVTNLDEAAAAWKHVIDAVMVDYEQQVRYYLELAPKLIESAQRLCNLESLGGLLLNPLGILGGAGNDNSEAVKLALDRIDAKVSQILQFLKEDLGPAVRVEVLTALSGYSLTQCSEKIRNEVLPSIAMLSQSPIAASVDINTEARALRKACIDVVSLCNTSVLTHGSLGPLACGVYAAILRASTVLLRISASEHSEFIKAWCKSMRDTLRAQVLDPANKKSLAFASTQIPVKAVVDEGDRLIPTGTTQLFVYWGMLRTDEVQGGVQGFRIMAFGAKLFAFSEGPGWQIDDQPRRVTWTDNGAETAFLPEPPHNNYYRQEWWPLSINFAGHWEDAGKRMKARADDIMRNSIKKPARYSIDQAIETVTLIVAEATKLEADIGSAIK